MLRWLLYRLLRPLGGLFAGAAPRQAVFIVTSQAGNVLTVPSTSGIAVPSQAGNVLVVPSNQEDRLP